MSQTAQQQTAECLRLAPLVIQHNGGVFNATLNICQTFVGDAQGNFKLQNVLRDGNNKDSKYKCTTCGHCFPHPSNLAKHMPKHSDATPYKCSVCDNRFKFKSSLKSHEITHFKLPTHVCQVCDKSFYYKSRLLIHEKKHNFDNSCPVCKRVFSHRGHLFTHMGTHSNIRNHLCQYCEKAFKKPEHLASHVNSKHQMKS